jgi:RNA polymerase sigma-70 factor (ECF subfamily)
VIEQLNQIPDRGTEVVEEVEWERAFDQRLLDWAAARVRAASKESTWSAFWRTAYEQEDPARVATDLGMSVGAVYAARCRVMARMRQMIHDARFDALDDQGPRS